MTSLVFLFRFVVIFSCALFYIHVELSLRTNYDKKNLIYIVVLVAFNDEYQTDFFW